MYSRFSVLKVKLCKKMKTKQLAPIGSDPIGSFLQSLPRKDSVLSCKWYRSAGQSEIYLVYSLNGEIVNTSFRMKGDNHEKS
jgi:hypothetical protein